MKTLSNLHPTLSATLIACLLLFFKTALPAATCTWNGSNGNWSDASKWSCGAAPTASDDVVVTGGQIILNVAASCNNLTMTGGSIVGIAASTGLTIGGGLAWSGGTFFGSSGGSVSIAGVAAISGAATKNLGGCTMTLNGGGTFTGGTINMTANAFFTVPSGQVLVANSSSELDLGLNNGALNDGTFTCAGTLQKQGTGDLVITLKAAPVTGTLLLDVNTGNTYLGCNSAHTGNFTIGTNAKLLFYLATQTLNGAQFSGAGSIDLHTTYIPMTLIANSGTAIPAGMFTTIPANGSLYDNAGLTFANLTIQTGGSYFPSQPATVSGNLVLKGALNTSANFAVGGTLDWSSGSLIGGSGNNVSVAGAAAISGAAATKNLNTCTLTLNGGGSFTGGTINIIFGGKLVVPVGQTLVASSSGTLSIGPNNTGGLNNGTLTVAGTLQKQGSGNLVICLASAPVTGTLLMDANAGALYLNTTAAHTGAFNIGTGSKLYFWADYTSYQSLNGATFSGAGAIEVGGGQTIDVNAGTTIPAGMLSTISNAAGTSVLFFNDYVGLTFNNLSILRGANSLCYYGGNQPVSINGNLVLTGSLLTTGSVAIGGTLDWSSVSIGSGGGGIGANSAGAGPVTVAGLTTFLGTGYFQLFKRSLVLNGGGSITDGTINNYEGANLVLPAGQTLTINSANTVLIGNINNNAGAMPNFTWAGTIEKLGTGTFSIWSTDLNFTGTYHLASGTSYLSPGGAQTGTFNLDAGTTLYFYEGNWGLTGALNGPGKMSIYGTGTVNLNAGLTTNGLLPVEIVGTNAAASLKINTNTTFQSLNHTIGSINGTATALAITGGMTWSSGTIAMTNAATFTVGGTLAMSGTTTLSKTNLMLNGGGVLTNADCTLQNAAAITNAAGQTLTVNCASAKTLANGTGGGTLTNNGTLAKTGAATFSVNVPYAAPAGSWTDLQAGTLDLNGTFNNSGTVKGTATLDLAGATVVSYGIFSPGPPIGTLNVVGNYTNSELNIDIAFSGSVIKDLLAVAGNVALGGSLTVAESGFVPAGSYPIVTSTGAVSGTFGSASLPPCFSLSYGPNSVSLVKTTYTFYADADGDGYGNLSVTTLACTAPSGFVSNSTDCDDANAAIHPGATEICNGIDDDCDGLVDEGVQLTFYKDNDGDGYGDAPMTTLACTAPAGFVSNSTDCDDTNAAMHPGATEICNGIDDDCDGLVDEGVQLTFYKDNDGDGYGDASMTTLACTAPEGFASNSTDCDDGNAAIHPGATEICNGIDDDCDGLIDEGVQLTFYKDNDGDGYGDAAITTLACTPPPGFVSNSTDCDDANAAIHPGATEICNGIDDDCDGLVDEGVQLTFYKDNDGDGYGDAAITTLACTLPTGFVSNSTDCDDANSAIHPGATEICNGIDDNCNGLIDEGVQLTFYKDNDGDGYGDAAITTLACTLPTGFVSNSTDCDDANSAIHPGATEICNGIDDDCDGLVDEGVQLTFYADADGDGYGNFSVTTLACHAPEGFVSNSTDCDDGNAAIHPGATEICNLIDDDCDGLIDEEVQLTFYKDNDGDGYGDAAITTLACTVPTGFVSNSTDCNDGNAAIHPGATEICGNGIDENCDGIDGSISVTWQLSASCTNGNANSITASAPTGCAAPYVFSKNGGATYQASPNFLNLPVGTYQMAVKDATGATAAHTVVIQPFMGLTPGWNNVSCSGGSDGSASVSVAGGYPPYAYLWKKGAVLVGTTQAVTNLAAGTYKVTVTDANGCTKASGNVSITQPSALTLTAAHTNATCNGTANGTATLNPGGGTAPRTFLWDDGSTAQNRGDLAAGAHSVTMTDANGCTKSLSVTITQPTLLVVNLTKKDMLCFGGSDGQATAAALGGTGSKTYLWNNGATTATISGLTIGTYSVTATDANGCTAAGAIAVGQPTVVSIDNIASVLLPSGKYNVTVTASGGTAPIKYQRCPGNCPNFQTGNTFTNVPAGSYTITVKDKNGCTDDAPLTLGNLVNGGDRELEEPAVRPGETGGIALFPNPASEEINIRFSETMAAAPSATLQLSDMTGRVVLRKALSEHELGTGLAIRLGDFRPGLYFLSVRPEGQRAEVRTFVVSRD